MCNIGFLGQGNFSCIKDEKTYQCWQDMIKRCYSIRVIINQPTYKDCTVCDEWHNFQNFAKWYDKNYNNKTMKGWQLDKDILVKNNKIYSPETCCFVPQEINISLINRKNYRGRYLIGVTKANKKYKASLSIEGKKVTLGLFETEKEAFKVYKKAKEKSIKHLALKYKKELDLRVFKKLIGYNIELKD